VEAVVLRDRLARLVGDPTLSLLYWLPEEGRYVDEAGRTAEPPGPDDGRAVMAITEGSAPVALLAHDPAVLEAPSLAVSVASATRLAVSNSRLQARVRARVAEVDASRRRIVEAADAQRRLLGSELREGPERRLECVAALVGDLDPELSVALVAARSDLRDLARGIHPATLTDHGLGPALGELAAGCPIPVDLRVGSDRLPSQIEAAAYFVCSEALTNVAKHAKASRVAIRVSAGDERLRIEVTDDGVGGADPSGGTGLLGLMDRVEALGGGLELDKPAKGGTRLRADVPLTWHGARG
jgi:signal transduction histidine kinase